MYNRRDVLQLGGSALSAILALPQASNAAEFTAKQMTIYVGFSPTSGIGYDTYARALSQVIGKYLPGSPTVIVANMPGGGSMAAANYIGSVAKKDGSEIAMVGRGIAMDRLVFGQRSAARFDATAMSWLGSMNNEVSAFFVSDNSPVKTLQDVLSGKALTVGSAGASSDQQIFSIALNAILGAKLKIINGYPGTNEILLSIERGEVDGIVGYSWAAARSGSADLLERGKIKNILQLGLRKHPDLPDVPLVMDLVEKIADRQVLELIFARQTMGRPLVGPQGLSPGLVSVLRHAFDQAMRDPDLVALAKKLDLEINPIAGADVQELVSKLHQYPSAVIDRTQTIANTTI